MDRGNAEHCNSNDPWEFLFFLIHHHNSDPQSHPVKASVLSMAEAQREEIHCGLLSLRVTIIINEILLLGRGAFPRLNWTTQSMYALVVFILFRLLSLRTQCGTEPSKTPVHSSSSSSTASLGQYLHWSANLSVQSIQFRVVVDARCFLWRMAFALWM